VHVVGVYSVAATFRRRAKIASVGGLKLSGL
jgi:hypothetical protein